METNNAPIYVEEKKGTNTVYYVIFGVICLIFVVVIGVLALNKNKINEIIPSQNSTIIEVSPTSIPTEEKTGYFQVHKIVADQNLNVEIIADSKNIGVVSFDLIFNFDKNKLELTELKSMIPGYILITKETENELIVTGTKNSSTQLDKTLSGEKIAVINFKIKQTGGDVSLIPQIGKRTTKFVDGGTNVYYPEIK